MFVICINKLALKIMKKKRNDFLANATYHDYGNRDVRFYKKKNLFLDQFRIEMTIIDSSRDRHQKIRRFLKNQSFKIRF